jgi:hypothetical protein
VGGGCEHAAVGIGIFVKYFSRSWAFEFSWVFFSGWSMDGMEVGSTASIRHLEEILFEKVESRFGLTEVALLFGGGRKLPPWEWYFILGILVGPLQSGLGLQLSLGYFFRVEYGRRGVRRRCFHRKP